MPSEEAELLRDLAEEEMKGELAEADALKKTGVDRYDYAINALQAKQTRYRSYAEKYPADSHQCRYYTLCAVAAGVAAMSLGQARKDFIEKQFTAIMEAPARDCGKGE